LEESLLTVVDEYSNSGICAQDISDNYIIITGTPPDLK
jgi:hypothetical protein